MNRRPTLLTLSGLLGLALLFVGACPEFGNDYPCEDDTECLNGMVCGSGGICVDAASDAGGDDGGTADGSTPDGSTPDGGTPDGSLPDGGDDGGTADAGDDGGTDGGTVTDCTDSYCLMPDSPTLFCTDGSDPINCTASANGPWSPQDGHVQGPQPSYLIDGDTILDEVTDLRWQTNPPPPSTFAEAEADCTALTLQDGTGVDITGWRLPSYPELMSIADWGIEGAVQRLPGEFGRNAEPRYWTDEEFSTTSGYHYVVNFDAAEQDNLQPSGSASTRCVKGARRWQGPLQWSNGSWLDPTSNLLWSSTVDQTAANLEESFAACAALTEGGYGWRVPTLKEWSTVWDHSKTALNPRVRDNHPATDDGVYWTSTPDSESPNSGFHATDLASGSKVFVYTTTSTSRRGLMCVTDG